MTKKKSNRKEDGFLTLRVAEGQSKDVGRGIARIDPQDFERIGAAIGDVVAITGKRTTAAKVMPAYHADRGKGIIQIDGIIRENAQASLDEKVRIHKVDHQMAKRITLAPLGSRQTLPRGSDSRYVARLLEGLVVTEGDRVRVNLFGTRSVDFSVTGTSPEGVVMVAAATITKIEGEGADRDRGLKVSYEDIGGLDKEIHRIREICLLYTSPSPRD